MEDSSRTTSELIEEISFLKQKIKELEKSASNRKQVEEALKESAEKYQRFFMTSRDCVFITSKEGNWIDTNSAAVELFGYSSREELMQVKIPNLYAKPEERTKHCSIITEHGYTEEFPVDLRRKDGMVIHTLITSVALCDTENNVIGFQGTIRDITERRKAEEALHTANVYNRRLIEASLDPLVTIGPDGKITDVNAATEVVTGYTRTELIGTEFSEYFTNPEQARAGYKEVFRVGSVRDYPLELRHRDGHVTSVLYNASVYRDDKGQVAGVFAAARDITDRKLAEEQLRALLQEKEILIREAHHRVKNNMQVMLGLLDLQAASNKNPKLIEMLNEGKSRIRAMALIHERLYDSKDFARIDLASYTKTLSQELFQAYKINSRKIDLIIQTDGAVYVDISKATPCGLILNELISNALKHAFPGDEPGKLEIIIRETKNAEIEILFRDNGLGIPDDVDTYQSSSVGLHLVNGLVINQLDGQIKVVRGTGTEFRIKFPL